MGGRDVDAARIEHLEALQLRAELRGHREVEALPPVDHLQRGQPGQLLQRRVQLVAPHLAYLQTDEVPGRLFSDVVRLFAA